MSETPPPPPGMPPIPPPPPPPGFGLDEKENEENQSLEGEGGNDSNLENITNLVDGLPSQEAVDIPPPLPPGLGAPSPLSPNFEAPPPPPAGLNIPPPPPPPGFSAIEEENQKQEDEAWDVDELDIQSFDDSLASLDQLDDLQVSEEPQVDTERTAKDWNAALDSAFASEEESQIELEELVEPQPALSSNLRPSAEVDAIPGDKLYVTLKEKEESVLNPDGTVRQQSIDGELILRNSSRKDRAWDIEVLLQNTSSTDIGGGAINVRELDATQSTNLPYTASGPRMMVVKEHIDTEPERPQESSLSMVFSEHSQEILIKITVENIAPVSLNDVVIRRVIPENFELIYVSNKTGTVVYKIHSSDA